MTLEQSELYFSVLIGQLADKHESYRLGPYMKQLFIENGWLAKQSADELRSALAEKEKECERLRKALEKIKAAPGGGPGRRIATQALEGGEK